MGVLNTFPKEKEVVNRERNANAYDTFSYFFAKFFTEMPLNVLPPLVFACIIYFIVGLNPNTFVWFFLIAMLEAVTAIALGLAISAGTPNIEAANALGPPLVIIALVFGGFYINLDSLPIVANWIPYFSFIRWAFEAMVINEFAGETFTCAPGNPPDCVITGESVLDGLSFGGHSVSYAVFGEGMVLIGFLFVAISLLYLSKGTFLNIGHMGSKFKHHVVTSVGVSDPTSGNASSGGDVMIAVEDPNSKQGGGGGGNTGKQTEANQFTDIYPTVVDPAVHVAGPESNAKV